LRNSRQIYLKSQAIPDNWRSG